MFKQLFGPNKKDTDDEFTKLFPMNKDDILNDYTQLLTSDKDIQNKKNNAIVEEKMDTNSVKSDRICEGTVPNGPGANMNICHTHGFSFKRVVDSPELIFKCIIEKDGFKIIHEVNFTKKIIKLRSLPDKHGIATMHEYKITEIRDIHSFNFVVKQKKYHICLINNTCVRYGSESNKIHICKDKECKKKFYSWNGIDLDE